MGGGQPSGEDGMEVEDSGQEVKRGMTLEELRSNGVDELGPDDLPEAEAGIAQQQRQGAQGQTIRDSL